MPLKEAERAHSQTAMELLIQAADHGGIVMLARIAMLKALNHGKPPPASKRVPKKARRYRIVTWD